MEIRRRATIRPHPALAMMRAIGREFWLGLALVAGSPFCAARAEDPSESMSFGVGVLALIALIAMSPFVLRRLIVRHLTALMFKASPEQGAATLAELEAAEVEATAALRFAVNDSANPLPGAVAARESFVARSLSLFRKAFLIDIAAGASYAMVLFLGGYLGDRQSIDLGLGLSFIGVIYMLLAVLRYGAYRKQFRASDARFGLSVRRLLGWAWPVKLVLSPRWQVWIGGLFIAVVVVLGTVWAIDPAASSDGSAAIESGRIVGTLLIGAGLLHGLLALWLARDIQRHVGPALLVLRVFGIDANARFTFGRLLAFWRHFGNYFTVVDPSFWRHRYPLFSLRTLFDAAVVLAVTAIAFVIITSLGLSEKVQKLEPLAVLVLALAGLGVFVWFSYRRIEAQFIRSRDHLLRLLERLKRRPRKLDMSFRSLEAMCHDNTWRLTVADFARRSDAVLMDLRGFSDARKGCEYEVDFLLDAVPIDRVVFLVEAGGDHDAVRRLILERWRMLRTTSPNLAASEPLVRLYVSQKQDGRDVQGILDLLISAAAGAEGKRAA